MGRTGPRAWHTEKFVVELRKNYLEDRQKYVYEGVQTEIGHFLDYFQCRREYSGWPDELIEICFDLIDDIDDLNGELTPTPEQLAELEQKLCPYWHWMRHSGYLSIWLDL